MSEDEDTEKSKDENIISPTVESGVSTEDKVEDKDKDEQTAADTKSETKVVSAETIEKTNVNHEESTNSKTRRFNFNKKIFFITGVITANLIIAAFGTTLVIASNKNSESTTVQNPVVTKSTNSKTTNSPQPTEKPVVTQQHYSAESLKAEFDYPSDWQIKSNPDNTSISIQSPTFQIKDSSGQLTNAQISIDITATFTNNQGNLLSSSSIISANSESLAYTNPTKVQRKTTHISYTSIDDTNLSSIGASFISGNLVYYRGNYVGTQNFKKINPFIIISIQKCEESCETNQYLSIDKDDFNNNAMVKSAKSIIKSFEFN